MSISAFANRRELRQCLPPHADVQFGWIAAGDIHGHARIGSERRYAQVLDAVITAVEPLDAASLRRLCPAEQCTAAALACHIAAVHGTTAGFVRAIVVGEALPPLTMEDIDRNNADNAAGNAERGKDQVIVQLRIGGEVMTTELRGLGEDDLARTAPFTLFGGEVSVHTLVEQAVITHTEQHLASLQAAVGTEASTSGNG